VTKFEADLSPQDAVNGVKVLNASPMIFKACAAGATRMIQL
jgi:hypothetical protein